MFKFVLFKLNLLCAVPDRARVPKFAQGQQNEMALQLQHNSRANYLNCTNKPKLSGFMNLYEVIKVSV